VVLRAQLQLLAGIVGGNSHFTRIHRVCCAPASW
jgi:hypothetical protein